MPRRALTAACVAAVAPLLVGPAGGQPAVVALRAWSGAGPADRATGTVVAPGRVLTVDHVVDGARRIEVRGSDGRPRRATVVARRPDLDLAILRVPGAAGPAVRFADGEAGLRVLLQRDGAMRPRAAGVRRRVVARLVDQPGRPRRPSLHLAVTVDAGDSGAPVVDRAGALVAVVYARSTRHGHTAYAVRGAALPALAGRD